MLTYLSLALSLIALALNAYVLVVNRRRHAAALLVEGYASAAAVHSATGRPVVVAPDPWVETIRAWLETDCTAPLTTHAILDGALPGTPATRSASMRITAAMNALGYRASRVRLPNQPTPTRVFQRAQMGGTA
jgi:hypothetical protein